MFLHIEKSAFRHGEYTALADGVRWRIIRCDDYWRAVATDGRYMSESSLRVIDSRLSRLQAEGV
jgi:hypothetical protein